MKKMTKPKNFEKDSGFDLESFNFEESDDGDDFFGDIDGFRQTGRPNYFDEPKGQFPGRFYGDDGGVNVGGVDGGKREKESYNFEENDESDNFFRNVDRDFDDENEIRLPGEINYFKIIYSFK